MLSWLRPSRGHLQGDFAAEFFCHAAGCPWWWCLLNSYMCHLRIIKPNLKQHDVISHTHLTTLPPFTGWWIQDSWWNWIGSYCIIILKQNWDKHLNFKPLKFWSPKSSGWFFVQISANKFTWIFSHVYKKVNKTIIIDSLAGKQSQKETFLPQSSTWQRLIKIHMDRAKTVQFFVPTPVLFLSLRWEESMRV